MRVRLGSTAVVAALALGAGGCGGAEPADDARAVLDEYVEAAEDDDIVAACELWSPWVARDQLTVFGAADRADELPENCEEIAPFIDGLLARVGEDPAIEETGSEDGSVTYAVEGIDGDVEIREFDGEWRFNSICALTECNPSTEEGIRAPIGG